MFVTKIMLGLRPLAWTSKCPYHSWIDVTHFSIYAFCAFQMHLGSNNAKYQPARHCLENWYSLADIIRAYWSSTSRYLFINSLRPSDAIWRQWSWTTLAQVMACCLTAPSHYLNQCWLIIRGVLWHTSESSFAGIAQGIDSGYEFEKDILKNIFKSPRGQWVNM